MEVRAISSAFCRPYVQVDLDTSVHGVLTNDVVLAMLPFLDDAVFG